MTPTLPPPSATDIPGSVLTGSTYPLPGDDPDAVRRSAARLAVLGDSLRAVVSGVHRAVDGQVLWVGDAAEGFASLVGRAPRHLDQVAARYDGYAAAMRDYASALDVDRDDARRRQAELARTGEDRAAVDPHSAPALAAGDRRCFVAYGHLAAVYEIADRHARICAHRLHEVDDHDQLHNPHGLHAAVDAAANTLGNLSGAAALLGVISLFVCPVAAPILFGASAALSAAKLGVDADRRVQYGEHVSAATLVVDALGVIPATGAAKSGAAGLGAARTAENGTMAAVRGLAATGRGLGEVARETWSAAADGARILSRDGLRTALFSATPREVWTSVKANWEATVGGMDAVTGGSFAYGMVDAVLQPGWLHSVVPWGDLSPTGSGGSPRRLLLAIPPAPSQMPAPAAPSQQAASPQQAGRPQPPPARWAPARRSGPGRQPPFSRPVADAGR